MLHPAAVLSPGRCAGSIDASRPATRDVHGSAGARLVLRQRGA